LQSSEFQLRITVVWWLYMILSWSSIIIFCLELFDKDFYLEFRCVKFDSRDVKRNRFEEYCQSSPNLESPIGSTHIHTHTHTYTRAQRRNKWALTENSRGIQIIQIERFCLAQKILIRHHSIASSHTRSFTPAPRFFSFLPERNATRKDRERTVRRFRAVLEEGRGKEPRTVSYVDRGPRADGHVNRLELDRRAVAERQHRTTQGNVLEANGRPVPSIPRFWNALFVVASDRRPRTDYGTFYIFWIVDAKTSDETEESMYRWYKEHTRKIEMKYEVEKKTEKKQDYRDSFDWKKRNGFGQTKQTNLSFLFLLNDNSARRSRWYTLWHRAEAERPMKHFFLRILCGRKREKR